MNTPERTYSVSNLEVQEQFDKIGAALSGSSKLFGVSGVYSERFVSDWVARGGNSNFSNTMVSPMFPFAHGAKNVIGSTRNMLDAMGRAY